jgi:hypothetical protein
MDYSATGLRAAYVLKFNGFQKVDRLRREEDNENFGKIMLSYFTASQVGNACLLKKSLQVILYS